ncbi:MAG: hypothetical protein RPS47_12630 [Colwellia sp.]
MSTETDWNLMYVVGDPEIRVRVSMASQSPMRRSSALKAAHSLATHSWRIWVAHKETGERIFESEAEVTWGSSKAEGAQDGVAYPLSFNDALSGIVDKNLLFQGEGFKAGTYIGMKGDLIVLRSNSNPFLVSTLILSKSIVNQSYRSFLYPTQVSKGK